MADYISRQKAIEAIMDLPNCPNGYSDTYDKACIIGMLEEVPTADVVDKELYDRLLKNSIIISEALNKYQTADVVEVVRCKDCDNWTDENGREGLCQVWSDFEISYLRYTPKDGYCFLGERRDDAEIRGC